MRITVFPRGSDVVILEVVDLFQPMDDNAVNGYAEQWWKLYHKESPVLKHFPRQLVTLESTLQVGSDFVTVGDFIAAGGTVSVGVKNRATNEWIPVLPFETLQAKLNSFSKKIVALEKAAVKSSEKVEALDKEQKELKTDNSALKTVALKSSEKVEALEKEQKELKGDMLKLGEKHDRLLGVCFEFTNHLGAALSA
ncbi:hypothetical protein BCR33DRAFT_769900 [Rhizoclosmatium globosum]|uniref:Uncharacterized protein n=1 Tax=Rhizoclosmatium globosum TaxID=329046 RepID=A0A1Y2BR95_9FUNG|nr:hypothetical protein BCR33DRAFT_769900 [Rhizoclosmatium globosum]|eukprot:ORY37262.1 hypothetical protein BCR33DRAFT_769900 [Rhizoclosmatium globosum]